MANLTQHIDDQFVACVEAILKSKGRVIVSGIGKSAIIAQKIVATLNSTGTPSIFMHAADAIHGDLGIIQKHDVIICISKSGDTPEIKVLVPLLRSWGNILIGMVGNPESYLAKQADLVLNTYVAKEACPNNLAPTSSSTAQMAMGTRWQSVCSSNGASPAATLPNTIPEAPWEKALPESQDIFPGNAKPAVSSNTDIKDVILEISSNRLGATAVLEKGKLVGVITDGDLRRMLINRKSIEGIKARDVMNTNPKQVAKDTMAVDALNLMKQYNISQLLVTDKGRFAGFVHLHDLVKEGIL